MSRRDGWQQFIIRSSRSSEGKDAMSAFRLQKQIAQRARKKQDKLWEIIGKHLGEQILIFTDDNAFAYEIGESLILPVLTHKTSQKERGKFLGAFSSP